MSNTALCALPALGLLLRRQRCGRSGGRLGRLLCGLLLPFRWLRRRRAMAFLTTGSPNLANPGLDKAAGSQRN